MSLNAQAPALERSTRTTAPWPLSTHRANAALLGAFRRVECSEGPNAADSGSAFADFRKRRRSAVVPLPTCRTWHDRPNVAVPLFAFNPRRPKVEDCQSASTHANRAPTIEQRVIASQRSVKTSEQRVSSVERSEKSSAQALICMDSSASSMHSGERTTEQAMSPYDFSVIPTTQAVHSLDRRRGSATQVVAPSPQAIAPSISRRAP
jgi:hypothetical protein